MNILLLNYRNSLLYSLWLSIFRGISICLVRTLRPRGREVQRARERDRARKLFQSASFFLSHLQFPFSRFDRADVGNVGYPVTIRQWISGFSEISFVFLIGKRIEVGKVISQLSPYNVWDTRMGSNCCGHAAKLISISPELSNLNFGARSLLWFDCHLIDLRDKINNYAWRELNRKIFLKIDKYGIWYFHVSSVALLQLPRLIITSNF